MAPDDVLARNKNLNRGFRKLHVWQEAIGLYVCVKKIAASTNCLSFKVKDQILSSALSISSNISEGYCRRSIKEYIQFVNIALGSTGENYSQIYALFRSEEIPKKVFDKYDQKHYSLENKLINLAKALSRKATKNDAWNADYKM